MNDGVTSFLRKTFNFRKKLSDTSDHGTESNDVANNRQQQLRHSFSDAVGIQHQSTALHDANRKQIVSEKQPSSSFTPAPPLGQSSPKNMASPRSSSNLFKLVNEQLNIDDNASVNSMNSIDSKRSTKTDLTQEDRNIMARVAERPVMSRPRHPVPAVMQSLTNDSLNSDAASECSAMSGSTQRTLTTLTEAFPNVYLTGQASRPPVRRPVREEAASAGLPADSVVSVLFAGKTKKGYNPNSPKKSNQDAFFMKHDPNTSSLIIGCFDGHGQYGHDVSRFCKLYMERFLCTHPSFHCDVEAAVIETTAALESEMLAAPHIDTVFSGATMSIMILRGTTVFVANVGDSRVVLGHCEDTKLTRTITGTSGVTSEEDCHTPVGQSVTNSHQNSPCCGTPLSDLAPPRCGQKEGTEVDEGEGGGGEDFPLGRFRPPTTVQLTVDHKPDLPAEMARIEQTGGRVKMVHSTARVYLATDDIPGLAMSRSLGDFVAHTVGVSSVPEIFQYDLSALCTSSMACGVERCSAERCGEYKQVAMRSVLLIGTDGVYDMISNEDAVALAFKHWGDPAAATEAIVSHTGKNWMARWGLADDTTLCVVNLEHMALATPGT